MYWDAVSKNYIPVPGGNSSETQSVTMTAEDQAILSNPAADAPLEMKKPSVPAHMTEAPTPVHTSAASSGPDSASTSTSTTEKKEDDDTAKKDKEKDNKEEKPRSLAAVKVALQLYYKCPKYVGLKCICLKGSWFSGLLLFLRS